MTTMAYRVSADGATVTFMSDVEHPDGSPSPEALALARDAHLLIHDSMFSDHEYQTRKGWGHSSVSIAIDVARRAGASKLALFHHSPDATDTMIDTMVESAQAATDFSVFGAREGTLLEVGGK
jgi:ribonuclease BN (tRNA processing enzyme)